MNFSYFNFYHFILIAKLIDKKYMIFKIFNYNYKFRSYDTHNEDESKIVYI